MSGPHGEPRARDPPGDQRSGFTERSAGKFGCGRGLNLNRQVDPIEDGTTDAVAVILTATGRSSALSFGVAKIAASARVHRGDELKPRRIRHGRGPPRYGFSAGLHWLAKRFQCLAGELRQLIQK